MGYRKVISEIVSLKSPGDQIEGYYIDTEENRGKRGNSNIHTIKNLSGDVIRCWGCAVIDQYIKALKAGDRFRATMTGSEETKEGQTVKLFDFEIWEND